MIYVVKVGNPLQIDNTKMVVVDYRPVTDLCSIHQHNTRS